MRTRQLIIVLFLLICAPSATGLAADPVARVTHSEGTVLVLRGGVQRPVATQDPLFVDDELRTGHNGRLVAEGAGGLQLVIGPASEVRLRRWLVEPSGGRLEAVLSMVTGAMRLLTRGVAEPSVDVETRAAVASVRSTEWLMDVTGAGTGVFAIEGVVQVTGGTASVEVGPGLGTDVVLGGTPSPPATWGAARLARMAALVPRP
jgi:hypothetical protein